MRSNKASVAGCCAVLSSLLAAACGGCQPEIAGSWQATVTASESEGPVPVEAPQSLEVFTEVEGTSTGCRTDTSITGLGAFQGGTGGSCEDDSYEASYGGKPFFTSVPGLTEIFVRQEGLSPATMTVSLRGPVTSMTPPDAATFEWSKTYTGPATRR